MEKPVAGTIVIVPFPFSDLRSSKRRPALVLADAGGDDIILCQITSASIFDEHAESLFQEDILRGSLAHTSNVRPNKLFTAEVSLIQYSAGIVRPAKHTAIRRKLRTLFSL